MCPVPSTAGPESRGLLLTPGPGEDSREGMIVCNRCAAANHDQARYCAACGHKLQSRRPDPDEAGLPRPTELTPGLDGDGGWFGGMLLKCLETWLAIGLLGGTVAYGLFSRTWWPVLAVGAVSAALLLLRKI